MLIQLWVRLKILFLNTFYSRFDIHDFSSEVNEIKHSCSVKDDEMEITEDAVLKVIKAINVRNCSGPGGVCGSKSTEVLCKRTVASFVSFSRPR